MMRQRLPIATAALAVAALLAGCGSQTKTVIVSSAPHPHHTTRSSSTSSTETTSSSETTTSSSTSSQATVTDRASTTRTASGPAFVGGTEAQGGAQRAAVATVAEHGYEAADPSQYHSSQTLRVLVGAKRGAAGGHDQRAFFFLGDRYIGTDASKPSASIAIVSQSDTEVTLAYSLYRAGDSLCCPSAGTAKVRFQLDNGKLVALGKIPPASAARGAGRL